LKALQCGILCRTPKTLTIAGILLVTCGIVVSPVMAAHHHRHSDRHSPARHADHARPTHVDEVRRQQNHEERLAKRQAAQAAHSTKTTQESKALHSGNVVVAARAFEGTRYVFGGTSRSGFDCSGFTRYILGNSAGVSLPRTAMAQYENGQSVDKGELQPGDLVFFKNTYRHGISHVGIYIGSGNFIHASNTSEGVTTNSLSEKYYLNHYAGARRVIASRNLSE
jgi:cell wall-associated NlpC family hydrolase